MIRRRKKTKVYDSLRRYPEAYALRRVEAAMYELSEAVGREACYRIAAQMWAKWGPVHTPDFGPISGRASLTPETPVVVDEQT